MKNKKNNNKKLIIGLIVFIIIITIIVRGYFIRNNKQENNINTPIKIGFVGPINDNRFDYGVSSLRVISIAVENINKSGGINGRNIELIPEDGKCDGETAANAMNKLVNENKVKFVIGGICSDETLAMTDISNNTKTILISPVSTSPRLSASTPYFFRNIVSDTYTAKSIAEYISNNSKNKTLAIISENTEYTNDFKRLVSLYYQESGGKIILNKNVLTDKDISKTIKEINKLSPDNVFINYQSPSYMINFVKTLKETKYKGNIYGVSLSENDFSAKDTYLNNVIISNLTLPDMNNMKYINLQNIYKSKYNEELPYPGYSASAFDTVFILKESIEKNGENTDKIKDYLHKGDIYNGLAGQYSFDKNGDVVGLRQSFQKIQDGKLININQK